MALYYINGTSNSGSTFGQTGFYYPLYLTQNEANAADTAAGGSGTSHPHGFTNTPNITFYMPDSTMNHAQSSAPTGSYNGEYYVAYTSPIAESDVQEIGTGVLASDTFDTWRKKTNDVGRETIATKAITNALNTDFSSLITVTGGATNIDTLSGSQIITGDKTFNALAKFPAADDSTNALQIGTSGKLHQTTGGFIFNDTVDNTAAAGAVKTASLEVTSGSVVYNSIPYTWPAGAPNDGQILKAGAGNSLVWQNEAAASTNIDAFVIEQLDKVGSVKMFAGSSLPDDKYVFCDGSKLSRTTYSDLYAAIGNTYALSTDADSDSNPVTGSSATHFRVPNLSGKVVIGVGTGSDNNATSSTFTLGGNTGSGGVIGEYSHDITLAEMPVHGHAIPTRYDDGNNSGSSAGTNLRSNFTSVNATQGGPSMPGVDNGRLKMRGNFVTGLAGGNSHTAATRGINQETHDGNTTNLNDGSGHGSAPFIGAGFAQEYTGQSKISQSNGNAGEDESAGLGVVTETKMNVTQPFIVLNYIIRAKSDNIAQLHLAAEKGIQLSSDGGTTYTDNTASNLLSLTATNSSPNKLRLNINETAAGGLQFNTTDPNKLEINPAFTGFNSRNLQGQIPGLRIRNKLFVMSSEIDVTNTGYDENVAHNFGNFTKTAGTEIKLTGRIAGRCDRVIGSWNGGIYYRVDVSLDNGVTYTNAGDAGYDLVMGNNSGNIDSAVFTIPFYAGLSTLSDQVLAATQIKVRYLYKIYRSSGTSTGKGEINARHAISTGSHAGWGFTNLYIEEFTT